MVVARPLPFTVAIEVAEEVHVTPLVNTCMVPLLYVPVAVNCCVFPAATDTGLGVTEIEVNTVPTVKAAVPWTVPKLAVIVAVPVETPFARPV